MSIGIRGSLDGIEVGTANPIDLNIATDQNMFKVFSSDIGTLNASSNATITHNLGYQPNFKVFMENLDDSSRMDLITSSMITNNARALSGTASLVIYNTDLATTRTYYYYIMYDPII